MIFFAFLHFLTVIFNKLCFGIYICISNQSQAVVKWAMSDDFLCLSTFSYSDF